MSEAMNGAMGGTTTSGIKGGEQCHQPDGIANANILDFSGWEA